MKLFSWNVNSIGQRIEHIQNFLQNESPDILCLQELKCSDDKFPFDSFASNNYQMKIFGQKTYNGVAIFSRQELNILKLGLGVEGFEADARFMHAKLADGLNIINIYLPNGQAVGSDKYRYKLAWIRSVLDYLKDLQEPTIICGDFNIAPDDIDVYDPKAWHEKILCSTPERFYLRQFFYAGYFDTFRELHPAERAFSWWDYRDMSYQKNNGLRIDLVLASKELKNKIQSAMILKNYRQMEKPSDHCPVGISLELR